MIPNFINTAVNDKTPDWLEDGEAAVLHPQVSAQVEEDAGRKNLKQDFF